MLNRTIRVISFQLSIIVCILELLQSSDGQATEEKGQYCQDCHVSRFSNGKMIKNVPFKCRFYDYTTSEILLQKLTVDGRQLCQLFDR